MLVPDHRRGTRIVTEHDFEGRIGRIAREILIRVNLHVGRMVDGEKLHLVEIDSFLERLHKTETQHSVFFSKLFALAFHMSGGGRNLAPARGPPKTKTTGPE